MNIILIAWGPQVNYIMLSAQIRVIVQPLYGKVTPLNEQA